MAEAPAIEIVVLTGMSGAGRRTAAHTMEDLGWYVVDNVPATLLPALAQDLVGKSITRLAAVLDVRSRSDLEELPAIFGQLERIAGAPKIVYLEASDAVIVRRQESNRRPVPLQGSGTMLEGIQAERWVMSTLRAAADLVIDTTELANRQLQARLIAAFAEDTEAALKVTVLSFGFKNGVPLDADLVLDMRFLPNPHWVPELRPQSGLSQAVSDYVLTDARAQLFLPQFEALFQTLAEGYVDQGKRLVEFAVGCTGGKHRSVAVAERLGQTLRAPGVAVAVLHRDLGRE